MTNVYVANAQILPEDTAETLAKRLLVPLLVDIDDYRRKDEPLKVRLSVTLEAQS